MKPETDIYCGHCTGPGNTINENCEFCKGTGKIELAVAWERMSIKEMAIGMGITLALTLILWFILWMSTGVQ